MRLFHSFLFSKFHLEFEGDGVGESKEGGKGTDCVTNFLLRHQPQHQLEGGKHAEKCRFLLAAAAAETTAAMPCG